MYLRLSLATGTEQLIEALNRIELAVGDRVGFRAFVASREWRE
jgi:hypothetical protein